MLDESADARGSARADKFDGPFVRTMTSKPVLGQAVEDTWLWAQPPNRSAGTPLVLHTFAHVGNGASAAGGHAWSYDGVHWHDTTAVKGGVAPYTGKVRWADGHTSVLGRRERPQALLRAQVGGGRVPEVLCTSAQAQTRGCPDGGPDAPAACRSFTMCEEIAL